MKALKTVVRVIGIIATVAAMIPGPWQPIAAIVAAVATVASAALEVAAPTRKARPNARGSPTEYRLDPNAGVPYLMGRTQYAGLGVKRDTWGVDQQYQGFTSVYSYGPINGIEAFTADRNVIGFAGNAATGALAGFMWLVTQLGACPSPALATPVAGWPGVNANFKLSGLAASNWVLMFDKKGKKFTSGPPLPGIIATGVKVYDPRLDSTYPGGSGPCRALDESTYVYSETPHLHALTYALGRYQNGKRRIGIGFPVSSINIPYFVNAANVDEANQWKIGGVIFSGDNKWNTLKMMMEAGGGTPITMGARLSGMQSAPKASLITIGSGEVVGRCSVTPTRSIRDRINTGVPRFRSEAHGWEYVTGDPCRVADYVATDGGQRSKEYEWTLVQQSKQAAQLTYYEVYNAREMGPIELTLKPRWIGLKPGDCVTLNIPELNLINVKVVCIARTFDPETGSINARFQSENDDKHAAALAAAGAAPPPIVLSFNPDVDPPVPAGWALSAGGLSTANGTVPTLRFTGGPVPLNVDFVEFSHKKTTDATWTVDGTFNVDTARYDVSSVAPGVAYQGRVRYIANGKTSAETILGPVTVETVAALSAGSATIASSITGQGPWATDPTPVASVLAPRANLIYDAGLTLSGRNWASSGGWTMGGANFGSDVGYYAAVSTTGMSLLIGNRMNVFGSASYTFSVWNGGGGYTNGTGGFQINWYDATDTFIRQDVLQLTSPGAGYVRGVKTVVSPANAVYARTYAQSPTMGGGTPYYLFYKPKFEYSASATVWTDDATFGSRYENGQVIDSLRPGELGANITESRTAAAIAGQGDLATANRASLPFGSNYLYNSDFARGFYGYYKRPNTNVSALALDVGINLNSDYGGKRNVVYAHVIGSPGAWGGGDYADFMIQRGFASGEGVNYQRIFGMPVKMGDLVYARCLAAQHRCVFELVLLIYDKDGGFIGAGSWQGARDDGFNGGGDPANANVVGGVYSLAGSGWANAATASLLFRIYSNGGADPYAFVADPALGILPPGQTALPPWQPGPTGRVLDPALYNTQQLLGPSNVTNIAPAYTVGASNVTVSFPAHTRTIAGINGPITLNYGACSATWPFESYWVAYIDDPDLTGIASPSVVLTATPSQLLYPNRYQIASGTTPTSAGTGGDAGGGGGGGYSDNCVAYDSFLPDGRQAHQVYAGSRIEILNGALDGYTDIDVEQNFLADEECVKLTSESGITLVCALTTPCTLEDGSGCYAPEVEGRRLPVRDADGFRWEYITKVEHVGVITVCHISCHSQVYAAGCQPGRFIYTHNPIVNYQKP